MHFRDLIRLPERDQGKPAYFVDALHVQMHIATHFIEPYPRNGGLGHLERDEAPVSDDVPISHCPVGEPVCRPESSRSLSGPFSIANYSGRPTRRAPSANMSAIRRAIPNSENTRIRKSGWS